MAVLTLTKTRLSLEVSALQSVGWSTEILLVHQDDSLQDCTNIEQDETFSIPSLIFFSKIW